MSLFAIKSLRQRLVFFVLVPAVVLLSLTGFFGFVYARKVMLNQWQEAAIAKLRWAAHNIDMRLSRPIQWVEIFQRVGGEQGEQALQSWVLNQLRGQEGVSAVRLQWPDRERGRRMMPGMDSHMGHHRMMRFHHAGIAEVTPPTYNTEAGHETVSLVSNLKDETEQIVGRLEVAVRFDYLMEDIIKIGWWQSDMACLVDDSGMYLSHTESLMKRRGRLGETNDPFEAALVEAMKENPYGTLRGPGHPPARVAGFYRLEQAPWIMILFASGEKVLAPIVRFRFYYALGGGLCILLIVLLIRSVAGKIVDSVKEISQAAKNVAQGIYGETLPQKSHDEIGQLTHSFNAMVRGLKERDFLSNTFGRYVDQEIAKELMRRPEATRLGGERREVVILFSDIRGFTALSESLSPDAIIRVLNHYFSHMIEVLRKHQAIIVDFFGDGILAFLDPLDGPVPSAIHRAIRCAMEMQAEMKTIRSETREEDVPRLEMGIGLNAGQVVVGNIGSEARAKYGIVGTPVNLTQRIQELARAGQVVISDTVFSYASESLEIEKSFEARLKGFREAVKLHVVKRFHDSVVDGQNSEGIDGIENAPSC
jgi:class 3 adenylate cyclase